MNEPRLTPDDVRIWDAWRRQCEVHARTDLHRRRVDRSIGIVREMMERVPGAYIAWSGGKDSTAMLHLAAVAAGAPGRIMAQKDDGDFPGEVEYLHGVMAQFGLPMERLDIIRPEPGDGVQAWLAAFGRQIDAHDDVHGRGSDLSERVFYGPIRAYSEAAGRPGVYLGLRTEESRGRRANRASRGTIYTRAGGEVVCTPLADWHGADVYGYLFTRGIEPLHVYHCVRLMDRPDLVRKSWWIPGAHTTSGGMVWLRSYYPSLWRRLVALVPTAGWNS